MKKISLLLMGVLVVTCLMAQETTCIRINQLGYHTKGLMYDMVTAKRIFKVTKHLKKAKSSNHDTS